LALLASDTPDDVSSTTTDLDALRAEVAALTDQIAGPSSLTFGASSTSIYQTTDLPTGWKDYGTGSLDITIEAEPWSGALGFLDLEASGGDGPDADVGTYGGLNGDAGSLQSADGLDRAHVLEAWISTPVWTDDLFVTFGKVDLGGYFDPNAVANDETLQFLYGGFVNSLAFEAPDPGPALVLSWLPAADWDVNVAVASADNSGDDLSSETFQVAQLGWYPQFGELPAEAHLSWWSDGSRDDKSGYGLSFSLECSETWSAFGRVGGQEECASHLDAVETAWSCGLEWREPIGSDDTLGLALGAAEAADPALDAEEAMELYYRLGLRENLAISLHVEHVDQPGGDPGADGVLALGLRLQADF